MLRAIALLIIVIISKQKTIDIKVSNYPERKEKQNPDIPV
jgi:hypothetical protein